MSDPLEDIRASFFVECDELLESLQDGLQAIEDGHLDGETINKVFRAVHSIKGGAGAFGLDDLVGFAHSFENTLDDMRNGRLAATPDILALLFQCADILSDLVDSVRAGKDVDPQRVAPILAKLHDLQDGHRDAEDEVSPDDFTPMALSLDLANLDMDSGPDMAIGDDPEKVFLITFCPAPELFQSGNEPLFLLRSVADLGNAEITCDISDVPPIETLLPDGFHLTWYIRLKTNVDQHAVEEIFDFVEGLCQLEIEQTLSQKDASIPDDIPMDIKPLDAKADPNPAPKPDPAPLANPTIRVDIERVDRLVNLVGELVINQAMLSQSFSALGVAPNSQAATELEDFQQLTRNIQDSVMMIRAQPVKSLFQRMARIVRESAGDIGKTVRFVTTGETTEIDKTMIERLAEPLTHMIRNAVDHGLEDTAAREEAGKPAQGTITLSASHRSGRVIVEVSDDGGGINREKVRQIAEDKGLIPTDQALSDNEIDNLLFLPGFSTADTISNISGRGVGMDVVKTAIATIGGRISIVSQPGQGSTFSISLPLTLAVLDGMIIKIGSEALVVPISAISETLALQANDVQRIGPSDHVVRVRDTLIPLLDLGAVLGYSAPRACFDDTIVLVVDGEDGQQAAVVIDEIEDQRQVVIKGLEDGYGHVPGIAAATILGDGQIALIIDPSDLLNRAGTGKRTPAVLLATG